MDNEMGKTVKKQAHPGRVKSQKHKPEETLTGPKLVDDLKKSGR